jgi:L-amino acid N-acyltransferase YncA
MKFASAITTVRRNVRNHGLQAAIYDVLIRSINKFVYLKTLECVVIEQVDPASMTLPAHFRYARLEGSRLSLYGRVKENELPEEFVQDALDAGDECYAVIDGTILASYGWYSKAPTLVDGDLRLHFDPQYVYMYKGFTAKPYRGKRLHAIGMMLALNEYRNQGFKGLVAYVESNNFDSLKSCYRMGYKTCGRIRVLRLANRFFIHRGQGCSDYGLELQPNSLQPRVSPMSCGS